MIDTSYQQFVQTVADGRKLAVETVKSFADGHKKTGQQTVELGIVDRLGTEEDARCWAAQLVGLDPEKTKCYSIEEPKPFWSRLVPSSRSRMPSGLSAGLDWVEFELSTSGQPLWLYRP